MSTISTRQKQRTPTKGANSNQRPQAHINRQLNKCLLVWEKLKQNTYSVYTALFKLVDWPPVPVIQREGLTFSAQQGLSMDTARCKAMKLAKTRVLERPTEELLSGYQHDAAVGQPQLSSPFHSKHTYSVYTALFKLVGRHLAVMSKCQMPTNCTQPSAASCLRLRWECYLAFMMKVKGRDGILYIKIPFTSTKLPLFYRVRNS